MSHHRPRGTLVDYLVSAIEPVLIMLMVGSLMFFMLDVWYQGEFLERLRWILFWFVLGIVLITRVSMIIGTSVAMGYGVALGGAVALVASRLTGFQPFLLVILGIVWWATHKLTFDCTLLDDDQDAGVGLLEESGLDPSAHAGPAAAPATDDPAAMHASLLPRHSWWKTWHRDEKAARRPNAPGLWVVYFTLASLPVFCLARWFVPAVEAERRAGLFLYFLVYIASGMGLLLATSFLNLRRYLRQRRLKMPAMMTAAWLSTGTVLIVGLTVLAAVFPLSGSGFRVLVGAIREESDLRASRLAMLRDSGVQGKGARSEGPAASKASRPPASSEKAEGSGATNDPNSSEQTSGQGRPGGASKPGRSQDGAPRGKPSPSQTGEQGKSGPPQDQSGDQARNQNGKPGQQAPPADQAGDKAKNQSGRSEQRADRGKGADRSSNQDDKANSKQNDDGSAQKNQRQSGTPKQAPRLPSLPLESPRWLRMLIIAAGVVALLFGLLRYGKALFWALRDLLVSLFGGFWVYRTEKQAQEGGPPAAEPAPPPRPFASFVNPFDNGLARKFSPNDLVLYSYEALEAWASEHNLARSLHETPIEFVDRLGEARADLRQHAAPVVGFFVAIVYGRLGFQADVLPAIRQFWRALGAAP